MGRSSDAYESDVVRRAECFLTSCRGMGEPLQACGEALLEAFHAQRGFLDIVDQRPVPRDSELQDLLCPTGTAISKVTQMESTAERGWIHHVKAVSESARGLTWVAYTGPGCGMPVPSDLVEESWQSAEFYTNKILIERRGTVDSLAHKNWVKDLKELFASLRDYVTSYHKDGPAWQASIKAAAPPPPPPPPPPSPAGGSFDESEHKQDQSMSAVFAEINQGEAVTSRLRKVTADMKSKNRTDEVAPPVHKPLKKVATKLAEGPKKNPVFELSEGRKWRVEFQTGNKTIEIPDPSAKQTVYLFECDGTMVHIRGKVNHITIDKCKNCAIIFESVVSACEVINSSTVEVQCTAKVPTITIDSTTGCQVFLGKDTMDAEILTAKCSEVNVLVPSEEDEEEMTEHPVPEQFVTKYCRDTKNWRTTPVSHA